MDAHADRPIANPRSRLRPTACSRSCIRCALFADGVVAFLQLAALSANNSTNGATSSILKSLNESLAHAGTVDNVAKAAL